MTRWLALLLAVLVAVSILTACIARVQTTSFRVSLPARVYAEKGWLYTCEVVSKPRVGGKMDCYLWQWQTPTPGPTWTPWVVTATPLAATATPTPTPSGTPGTPYP